MEMASDRVGPRSQVKVVPTSATRVVLSLVKVWTTEERTEAAGAHARVEDARKAREGMQREGVGRRKVPRSKTAAADLMMGARSKTKDAGERARGLDLLKRLKNGAEDIRSGGGPPKDPRGLDLRERFKSGTEGMAELGGIRGNPDVRKTGCVTIGAHNPHMRGDHPQAHGGEAGGGSEPGRRGAPRRPKGSALVRALAINVCGIKPERRSEASNTTPEAGSAMMWTMSDKLRELVDQMKGGGIHIGVWADTHLSREESRAVSSLIEEEGYGCYWTEGVIDQSRRTRGVMVVWDMREVQVYKGEEAECEVIEEARSVKVKMGLIRDGRKVTVIGVYMPVRSAASRETVEHSWDMLDAAYLEEMGDVMIGGDFNAETAAWRERRGAKHVTYADTRLEEVLENGYEAQARAATYRAGTQIDNWLVNEGLGRHMGTAETPRARSRRTKQLSPS